VKAYFQSLEPGKVERFALPRLFAFNFVLWNVLAEALPIPAHGHPRQGPGHGFAGNAIAGSGNLAAMLPPEAKE